MKSLIRRSVRALGYDLVRHSRPDARYARSSFNDAVALPAAAASALKADNPRLLELRDRYARTPSPMAARGMWGGDYLEQELNLQHFRGDNAYVWQFRNVGAQANFKYYCFLRDLISRDEKAWLQHMDEDGLFGCWTFDFEGWPRVSRDVLDSLNELLFLQRHLDIASHDALRVLDIGAGYGRLAHRANQVLPGLADYICVDGVPDSTFLCEFYTAFRGCDKARVLPVDELEAQLQGETVDLAINIHSFSEMPRAAIDAWLGLVAQLRAPWLLVVPNDADQLISYELDGARRDFRDLFGVHGYTLHTQECVIADPTLRQYMNVSDQFLLFRRASEAPA